MRSIFSNWQTWALLSAVFAALTAIFGKVGVQRIEPDFATLIRIVVILVFVATLVVVTGAAQPLASISAKTYTFLALSGLATGASWLCYYRALKLGPASHVAPLDKLSVVLVALIGVLVLGESMSVKNWLGIALITGGAVLVSLRG
jgi:bacterial/archaeal transporter family protein